MCSSLLVKAVCISQGFMAAQLVDDTVHSDGNGWYTFMKAICAPQVICLMYSGRLIIPIP